MKLLLQQRAPIECDGVHTNQHLGDTEKLRIQCDRAARCEPSQTLRCARSLGTRRFAMRPPLYFMTSLSGPDEVRLREVVDPVNANDLEKIVAVPDTS